MKHIKLFEQFINEKKSRTISSNKSTRTISSNTN